jgi:hypothetical protein
VHPERIDIQRLEQGAHGHRRIADVGDRQGAGVVDSRRHLGWPASILAPFSRRRKRSGRHALMNEACFAYFTAPNANPCTRYRCNAANTTATGSVASKVAAIT